jgi:hypothetical protein
MDSIKRCVHCGSSNGTMITAPGGGWEHWPTNDNRVCLSAVEKDVERLNAENEQLRRDNVSLRARLHDRDDECNRWAMRWAMR